MQKIYTISLIFLSFLAFGFKSMTGLEDVINALKTGNATELSRYVDENIEIAIPEKTDTYSHSQAVMVLQDFFKNSGVKGFELQFKGENGGNQYCVGKLITRSGNYRTTVFMKTKGGKQLVKEIRFQSF